jgi:predicted nucleotidyltransferase
MSADFVRYDALPVGALRAKLLEFGARFVAEARTLQGVTRIAVLGSILTQKPDPKDIDLLATVTDTCDLAPLARCARRLQGRAQGLNHSADVFLASPEGQYLGRTCYWRDCRPGVRASCDAIQCGGRPYLHDDLHDVTVPVTLIAAPPLELWPAVIIRATLPPDIAAWIEGMASWAA